MVSTTPEAFKKQTRLSQHIAFLKDFFRSYDKMPAYKVGRLWRFKISEVDEWLKTPEGQNSVIMKRDKRLPVEGWTKRPYQKHYIKQEGRTNVQQPTISYKPLFKMLIDREIKKKELAEMADISIATITKMGKNGNVNTDVLEKICKALNCKLNDIVTIVTGDTAEPEQVEEVKIEPKIRKPVRKSPAIAINRDENVEPKVYGEYSLTPTDQEIAHYIYEQLKNYKENPPAFMVNTVLLSHKNDAPNMTYEEAKNSITTDRYYSLVLNEVFDTWGHLGWEFEKKHIPFDLIESGFFEDDQEETFGEMTMQ